MLLKRNNKYNLKNAKHGRKISDHDGLTDGEEVRLGRNPNRPRSLKDFFVPHAGNNHHPHALHPKRIIFHIATAALIKTIAVVFIMLFPMSAWLTPELSAAQSKKIIALTNDLRIDKSAPMLIENSFLNLAAYKKTQDMLINQYFAHTSPDSKDLDFFIGATGYKYSVAGENLAMGFSDADSVMKAWENSPTHYSNLVDPDFKQIGVAMSDGIFKGENTTLAAQYFARPAEESQAPQVVKAAVKISPTPAKASVAVSEPAGKKERVIMAKAELPADTTQASVVIGDKKIEMQKNSTTTWAGSEVVAEKDFKVMTKPVILASISSTDASNTVTVASVESQNIKPQPISLADQYFLLKNNPNKSMAKVMDISSFYFFFLLIIVLASLMINVFLKARKQHPSLVLGGVTLAAVLLIFLII